MAVLVGWSYFDFYPGLFQLPLVKTVIVIHFETLPNMGAQLCHKVPSQKIKNLMPHLLSDFIFAWPNFVTKHLPARIVKEGKKIASKTPPPPLPP